jgi:tRNA(Ile)-lysidine synthase
LDSCDSNTIYVDFEKLQFPLELRTWKNGDYFYPKGMKGKKKISKFFKDEKMSLTEKDKALLLCSDAQVVWVVGRRQDSRFVASKTDTLICKISLQYATD